MSSRSKWKLLGALIVVPVVLGVVGWRLFAPQLTEREHRINYIDTHAHLLWEGPSGASPDYAGVTKTALETMRRLEIQKTLIMPPPFAGNMPNRYDWRELAEATRKNPERFAVLAGGGALNPMIESIPSGRLTPDTRRNFEEIAEGMLRNGALAFGEMNAEHLSLHAGHIYESAPPDHPLFLLLVDIAGRHDVIIDLHMEAVPQDMPLPKELSSPANPIVLRENIAAFERLLSHNRNARIVWAHAGWDNTGYRTVELMRQLLQRHPNLYMSVKISRAHYPQNSPLNEKGDVRQEWMDLIRSFPDRFVIGSDRFYAVTGVKFSPERTEDDIRVFLNQLPVDLARKVAYENAVIIYKLK